MLGSPGSQKGFKQIWHSGFNLPHPHRAHRVYASFSGLKISSNDLSATSGFILLSPGAEIWTFSVSRQRATPSWADLFWKMIYAGLFCEASGHQRQLGRLFCAGHPVENIIWGFTLSQASLAWRGNPTEAKEPQLESLGSKPMLPYIWKDLNESLNFLQSQILHPWDKASNSSLPGLERVGWESIDKSFYPMCYT